MKERGYPNREFRALVRYSNEARKNKRIKFYENKKPKEINFINATAFFQSLFYIKHP